MQSLDFGVMVDSYSPPNPLCSHGRPPFCAQVFRGGHLWLDREKFESDLDRSRGFLSNYPVTALSCAPAPEFARAQNSNEPLFEAGCMLFRRAS
jgi:hypothetical protein